MKNYLLWLRNEANANDGNSKRICLILDSYSVHTKMEVKKLAERLNIELIFVPPNCTAELQPLDKFIFGVLKIIARKKWYKRYSENPEKPISQY